jgi:hypothetical protein
MAGILNEFVQNTKILASQVNENFATVQNDMEELGNGLNVIINNELTKTKADLLEDIETVSNNKASKDLSDAEPSAEFKANILDYVAPDYLAGYSISSGFTAPSAGWCYFRGNQDTTSTVDVGGVGIEVSYDSGDGQSRGSLSLFVSKGTTVTAFSNIGVAKFYPRKGLQ